MNLPRSTYYHKPTIEADDQDLIAEIEAIIEEFSGYGYRRVTQELHRRGKPVNHKKVQRIMKERGLQKRPKHRWIRTTDSNHGHRVYPNLMQNLAVTGPNQAWAADITYIGIRSGFVYLAVILDLFARRAVGYAISRNIDTALCLEALQMAIADRRPPRGDHPSLRSRRPVRLSQLCGGASQVRFPDQHVPERESLRQCCR
jgi:putative transposase